VQQIGDLDFLIRAVVSAVLAALLFATATMMMQSVRERTPELAVLKTIGFTDRAVFLLILAEAVAVCVVAAACGLALSTLVFPFAGRFVFGLAMPKATVAIGLALGAALALVSAAIPAARAARLRVVSALAGR
jgi:putative ABC transport system permease protein